MRPFNGRKIKIKEKLFNRFFKSARLTTENAIWAWKQICPLLNIGMHHMDPEKVVVLYQFDKARDM